MKVYDKQGRELIVLSVSDADAILSDVLAGKTFYAGSPERKTGTLEVTLAEDILGEAQTPNTEISSTGGYKWFTAVPIGGDVTLATKTQAYDAASRAVAVGSGAFDGNAPNIMKLRLYMGGVQVAETGWLESVIGNNMWRTIMGTRALSGSQTCYIAAHNYDSVSRNILLYTCNNNQVCWAGIAIGSIKKT